MMAEADVMPEVLFPERVGFGGALEGGGEMNENLRCKSFELALGEGVEIALAIVDGGGKLSWPRFEIANEHGGAAIHEARDHLPANDAGPAADEDSPALHPEASWDRKRP